MSYNYIKMNKNETRINADIADLKWILISTSRNDFQ